eukprot:3504022-Amphidinium_carterae.2
MLLCRVERRKSIANMSCLQPKPYCAVLAVLTALCLVLFAHPTQWKVKTLGMRSETIQDVWWANP